MASPSVAVIVPTYNERENLDPLVRSLLGLPLDLRVIVVDDASPDGTGAVADALARETGRVDVIHRPGKLGLGTAYAAGFGRAMELGASYVVTMDADFSHNPSYVPSLVAQANSYDLVIGSRYVAGGGVRCWGWHRRILSWGANAVARLALGLRAHDCTAGFRCYRQDALRRLDLAAVKADGYSYLIEVLFLCQHAGFRIGEVPIIFVDRRMGRSKISRQEIFKAGWTVMRLMIRRIRSARRVVRAR
ncbi:MAG: polyprenol monophosphomannose synthase [Anaerolineae bacterium]